MDSKRDIRPKLAWRMLKDSHVLHCLFRVSLATQHIIGTIIFLKQRKKEKKIENLSKRSLNLPRGRRPPHTRVHAFQQFTPSGTFLPRLRTRANKSPTPPPPSHPHSRFSTARKFSHLELPANDCTEPRVGRRRRTRPSPENHCPFVPTGKRSRRRLKERDI